MDYSRDGPSNQCITRDFNECPVKENQDDCVGVQGANYVYRIISLGEEQDMERKDARNFRLRKHPVADKNRG